MIFIPVVEISEILFSPLQLWQLVLINFLNFSIQLSTAFLWRWNLAICLPGLCVIQPLIRDGHNLL